jgi:CO dehydrogenase nickel-insertion accessory protein CooC1/KaiC/GvpD/RAD55 family RecA-like ATPase
MIAIAGAKGGCGKTTAALGITEAFARAGTPTLAVDADRQLPDLHVTAGLEPEPTLAAVESHDSPTDVAQTSERADDALVLPAPRSSQSVDLQSTLEALKHTDSQVVVDCPSGAGPDVVEPMSVIDEILVVTDGTNRSVSAAKTTVDIARRLDVPVVGVLLNRCETVPEEVETSMDVPVLGTVPDRNPPLESPDVQAAYDDLVGRIRTSNGYTTGAMADRETERLSTGVDTIDSSLDGGLLPGTVVALSADPDGQSEFLLYELTTTRGTLYLTTERSESVVQHAIDTTIASAGKPTIRTLDSSNPLSEATKLVKQLPEGANLIIDSMRLLERQEPQSYSEFLNTVTEVMKETDGIAMLHCLNRAEKTNNRGTTEYFADVVFDLDVAVESDAVGHHLTIPKSRRERAPSEPITLDVSTQEIVGD